MLKISYLEDSHHVELFSVENSRAWEEIRSGYSTVSTDFSLYTASRIVVPFWVFISSIQSLVYIIRKYSIPYKLDEKILHLIKKSASKEKSYKHPTETVPISPEAIVELLEQKGFKRKLTPEQLRNVSKLYNFSAGATFSVPGAGKTTEALALFMLKKEIGEKLFIVGPPIASVAWKKEISECFKVVPNFAYLTDGHKKIEKLLFQNPDVMFISYDQLLSVFDLVINHLTKFIFFMCVDESHRIKGGENVIRGRKILSIAHLPEKKLIMSGTPLPNSLRDLIPQFKFLYPECNFEESNIVDEIQSIFVRTTKEELKIPKCNITFKSIKMSESQVKIYNLLRSEELRRLELQSKVDLNIMRLLGKSTMKLLQAASNPSLLLKGKNSKEFSLNIEQLANAEDSPKIKYACTQARNLSKKGEKLIIWTNFRGNVELLTSRLKDLGADYIHGGVPSGSEDNPITREAKIKRFHEDPNAYVLIANPAAAGEGISLHKVCHHAIYIDRNYNAAQFLQSVDRIHRYGLKKTEEIEIEILYSPNTIDESVQRRMEMKIEKMSQVLNDPSLLVETQYADEETFNEYNGLLPEDADDFIKHLKGWR